MNARVFLLVMFSLMFMGVWDADQRSADAALAQKNSKRLPAAQARLAMPKNLPGVIAHAAPLTADTSSAGAAALSAVGFSVDAAQLLIPMPKNLASGTWQVMTESGRFFRIEIDRTVSEKDNADQFSGEPLEESFCVTTTPDGTRWCFVRFHTERTMPGSSNRIATDW